MSKRVTRVTPLWPASSAAHVSRVPRPRADTSPMPVMTTRLFNAAPCPGTRPDWLLLSLAVRLDVLDGFLHAGDLFGVLVGDFDAELLFERHHELHRVERVGAQVIDERRVRRHLFLVHAQLLHDDALHLVCDCHLRLRLVVGGWSLVVR